MPQINVTVETPISNSVRAAQVSSMFDVPPQENARLSWRGSMPIEAQSWNVGLIVGPSGCGKSTLLNKVFGRPVDLAWGGASVIDDFPKELKVDQIAEVCQAVGFNTIPAWLRPKSVLSNGEQFRVELARRLLECPDLITVDEFTSVVDRQVAQIGSNAVQKFVRRHNRQFVAATCHYDLEEWLQPDWMFEPATMSFRWRSVQRRPDITCTISRVGYEYWSLFARYHYLTAELHKSARCYLLSVDGKPASFAAVLYRPHPIAQNIYGLSRSVTLPDFQGLGLAFALSDKLGSLYRVLGKRLRSYPAHPPYMRARDRSRNWALVTKPGFRSNNKNPRDGKVRTKERIGDFGGRPCAVFEYCGPAGDRDEARRLMGA